MSFEDDHYSSCARRDEFKSRIAKDLHQHGSHTLEIGRQEEAYEEVELPSSLLRLCRANEDTLKRNNIDPEAFSQWQLDLINYRVPSGFASLEDFVEYFSGIVKEKRPKVKPYYKVVYERRNKG